jgi:DNA-binding response OmpR family regulator
LKYLLEIPQPAVALDAVLLLARGCRFGSSLAAALACNVTAHSLICHQGLTVILHNGSVKIELTLENEKGTLAMKPKINALLVHHRNERFYTLQLVLEALSIGAVRARSAKEAEKRLCDRPCPQLVLSDTVLPDGNWMDVLDVAAKAVEPVNVIIVAPTADTRLYLDTMDHGAFDFMTDSFTVPQVVHILKCALDDISRRRGSGLRVAAVVHEEPRRLTVYAFESGSLIDNTRVCRKAQGPFSWQGRWRIAGYALFQQWAARKAPSLRREPTSGSSGADCHRNVKKL